jgi:hypothetical protein
LCALGAGIPALVLGAPGRASAIALPPITTPPITTPPALTTPPTVTVSPDDGLHVQLPPLDPDDGDGLSVGLPGFPPITTPVTLAVPPTTAASSPASTRSSSPRAESPGPTTKSGAGSPASAAVPPSTTTGPHFEAAHIDSTSARVVGVVNHPNHSGFWSTIGSAAVAYWFWLVLCGIALVVRFVAIAAWRDRMRATD